MLRHLRPLAVVMITSLTALAATSKPLVFEVSFPRELSATSVDGHVLLILSKDDKQEPRFEIAEGIESQQAFGIDVEGWQPNAAVRGDASILGYPIETLNDLIPRLFRAGGSQPLRNVSLLLRQFVRALHRRCFR